MLKLHISIVGKIKTRSYVDKDGINKYITEILADTLLVLDKKQGQISSNAQADLAKNDIHGKGSSGQAVNEAASPYASPSADSKNWPESGEDMDDLQKNGQASGQNEDDLPF